ncbi:hypothetical protein Misp01_12570 [Microtetraspora sp. NBRC 13810]|nr:hypothetical protein Misp01_12570 [Microtetraspora sp. NBRC 13810]
MADFEVRTEHGQAGLGELLCYEDNGLVHGGILRYRVGTGLTQCIGALVNDFTSVRNLGWPQLSIRAGVATCPDHTARGAGTQVGPIPSFQPPSWY